MKILARGSSAKCDKILSWLVGASIKHRFKVNKLTTQDGAFDAVAKGYLDSLQLSILLERHNSDNVVESYTFSFSYRNNPISKQHEVNGVVFKDLQGSSVTVTDARQGLDMIMSHLVQLTSRLPHLPGQ